MKKGGGKLRELSPATEKLEDAGENFLNARLSHEEKDFLMYDEEKRTSGAWVGLGRLSLVKICGCATDVIEIEAQRRCRLSPKCQSLFLNRDPVSSSLSFLEAQPLALENTFW